MSVPETDKDADENALKLTTTKISSPPETVKLSDSMQRVPEEPRNKFQDSSIAGGPIKVLDNSPLKKDFKSKAELEQTDKLRLAEYNMYWHLKEFDPIDIVEHMDLDEKFKKKQ